MKLFKYILFLSISAFLCSCGNSFLDLSPKSNANANGFYKDRADFETAMVSAYNTLYTTYNSLSGPYYFGCLMSDDAYTEDLGSNPADYPGIQKADIAVSNTEIYNTWNNYYTCIHIINSVIDKLKKADFPEKEEYEAEMRFLRALHYFDMVRMWGAIPLATHTLTIEEAYALGRTPEDQVYTFIIDDLKFGTSHLPKKGNERFIGAATSGAAYALLGKVYLTNGQKDLAAQTLQNIYNKEYKLVNYADLWDFNKKNCNESIFEIQYIGGKGNPYSTYWSRYTPIRNLVITKNGGGHNQITDDLWNAFEEKDIRKSLSFADGYVNVEGKFVATPYTIKWKDEKAELNNSTETARNNYIVLRYADVLLMLTEATGDVKYLNEVRERAHLPYYGEAGYPTQYNTVALAVEHERHVEFATEFHRGFDLKRLGRLGEVLSHSSKAIVWKEGHDVWPIPEDVIIQNPALAPQQNPAYK